jgi:hypothetical protein
MEPVPGGTGYEITLRTGADQAERLASCDDHGPPIVWLAPDLPIPVNTAVLGA